MGSFGDGPGEYKRLLDETGLLASYTAYDGSPYAAENSEGRVFHLDLTIAAFGLPSFDWVISLEVAEHIPALFERYVGTDLDWFLDASLHLNMKSCPSIHPSICP